ncbi:MAG: helix-turn-helix transcriptional regulator [Synergistaceae bacterium]|nr:helix-turn-helix transcriptional regulator [Synergistaceae bacterium]
MYGERAKRRRKELGLSGEKVAEALGTTRVTVSRWESDTSEPDDRTKMALAKVLNTSVAYLIGETDNPNISETGTGDGSLVVGAVLSDESSKETLHKETPGKLVFKQGDCYIEVPDTPSNQVWFKELTASVIRSKLAVG